MPDTSRANGTHCHESAAKTPLGLSAMAAAIATEPKRAHKRWDMFAFIPDPRSKGYLWIERMKRVFMAWFARDFVNGAEPFRACAGLSRQNQWMNAFTTIAIN
jgi:hypothetical protein